MGWSMDRQGIRTLFDHESKRLKQVKPIFYSSRVGA
jgi:hypothetical protein